jgi:hypothetical protein
MKHATALCLLLLAGQLAIGQVIFRNDFILNRKLTRIKSKGLTYVTFGVGSHHKWNLNAYGQPARSIRIDVQALLGRKKFFYQDVVESMYRPMAVYRPAYIPIPFFIMQEPLSVIKILPYSFFAKRTLRTFSPATRSE